ncbi:hypothetical protein [Streptomyces sp. NPDC051684]|uniref:hypothetical protein n=1 Tax=Streptomyces sp. NPDC051684 TaxID=3365670 RepID=UPI0037B5D35D
MTVVEAGRAQLEAPDGEIGVRLPALREPWHRTQCVAQLDQFVEDRLAARLVDELPSHVRIERLLGAEPREHRPYGPAAPRLGFDDDWSADAPQPESSAVPTATPPASDSTARRLREAATVRSTTTLTP